MNVSKSNSNKNHSNDVYTYERRPIMNFSDLVEDKTIHMSPKSSFASNPQFEPDEISGRSTDAATPENIDEMSVDDILGASFVQEIRFMSRQGADQASIRISLPNGGQPEHWNRSVQQNCSYTDSLNSDCFQPAEHVSFEKFYLEIVY